MAKIDKATADKIRAEAKHWKERVLALRYGLRREQISAIINGRAWA